MHEDTFAQRVRYALKVYFARWFNFERWNFCTKDSIFTRVKKIRLRIRGNRYSKKKTIRKDKKYWLRVRSNSGSDK